MKFFNVLLLTSLFISTASSAAQYDPKTGVISQIDVSAGNNMGFRVYLKDMPFECGNGSNHAYLNESDSNYQTYVNVLLAAKMSKNPVRIYNVAGTSNNCRISYVILLEN